MESLEMDEVVMGTKKYSRYCFGELGKWANPEKCLECDWLQECHIETERLKEHVYDLKVKGE